MQLLKSIQPVKETGKTKSTVVKTPDIKKAAFHPKAEKTLEKSTEVKEHLSEVPPPEEAEDIKDNETVPDGLSRTEEQQPPQTTVALVDEETVVDLNITAGGAGVLSSVEGDSEGMSNVDESGLIEQIRAAIQKAVTYPPIARKRRLEGTVLAEFSINDSGVPEEIKILKSSGFSILDREVIKIIKRASPYPVLSEKIEVPISFRLVEEPS